MSFLIGQMERLDGHKDLTANKDVLKIDADQVSIALAHRNGVVTCLVKEGDEVKIGDLIAKREDNLYVPIFASVSGTVKGIEKKMTASLKPADHVVIVNNHKDEKAAGKTLADNASKEEIVNYMKEIGLLGEGGAGFPAYIKYSTDKCETLIVNAVECEPFITADAKNTEENIDYLKQGIKFALKASGAKKVYVCLKAYHADLIKELANALKDMEQVEVKAVPDYYPMGWERTLIKVVLGKSYENLPIETGAIVSNVSTLISLAKSAKTGLPVYEKMITVSGNAVKDPHNVLARVGTPIKDLVAACGGYTEEKVSLIVGGPMMGTAVTKEEVAVTNITNAITVLKYEELETVGCLGCGRCVEACPSGLIPCNIVTAAKAKDKDRLLKLHVHDCIECGSCAYICPSKIEVTELIRRAKKTVAPVKK